MTKRESLKAKRWLASRNLTIAQLAELTGYAEITIYWFFRGETPPDRRKGEGKIQPWVWQRFKAACAGVDAQLAGRAFDW